MDYVTRIHLNIKEAPNRRALIDYCLNSPKQCLAIGWSSVYDGKTNINNYEDFYSAIKEKPERINHVLNVFRNTKPDDLFWTRDLNGDYWICRVLGKAEAYYSEEFKTGAIIPVKAYKFGMQVPGEIKASFNRPRGGTAQEIKDASIVEYSKYIYNKLSGSNYFEYNETKGDLLDNLPDFDLEELVICYLQIVKNYYVLSNSIANKSTTIKMECELTSRNKESLQKAVVQVKGGKSKRINALDYKLYADNGYTVYLFAPHIENLNKSDKFAEITRDELQKFYNEYKCILPKSITEWENLFNKL